MKNLFSYLNRSCASWRPVRWVVPSAPCDRCSQPAPRVWDTGRTAIDIDLDQPVYLEVTVSVHSCVACHHTFRAQPPFLRRDAIYTNRVVAKAVASVYRDGMAVTRVAQRPARDFWVRPCEGTIRRWCHEYAESLKVHDKEQRVTGNALDLLDTESVGADQYPVRRPEPEVAAAA